MREIKRIDVLSAGKVLAVLAAVTGLLVGAIVSLMALVGGFSAGGGDAGGAGMIMGAGAIICFPLMYAVFGFIEGIVVAFVYNLIAGSVGGFKIELSE